MSNLNAAVKVLKEILHKIEIADVMSKSIIVIEEGEDFSQVEEIFVSKKIRHLPVVNSQKEIVGLISQRDLYKCIAPRRAPDGNVVFQPGVIMDGDGYYKKESLDRYILRNVMKKDPRVLTAEQTLGDAIHLMVTEKSGCVPIVDQAQHVIGLLTRFDILRLAARALEV